MGLCVSYAVAFIPAFMTQCKPIAASWDPTLGHCRPIQRQQYASVSVNMTLDLLVGVLPMPTVWALKMSVRKKLSLTFLFSVGLLYAVNPVPPELRVKYYIIHRLIRNSTVGIMAWRIQITYQSANGSDAQYFLYYIALQSHLELWLGTICASLPTLAPIASNIIFPAVSKFVSAHRKLLSLNGSRKSGGQTASSSDGDVPLQRTGFNRLDGERLSGSGDLQQWAKVESVRKDRDFLPSIHGDHWSERDDVIAVRHDFDVFAEPSQQV